MKEIVKQDIYVNVVFDFFFQNLLAGTLPATLAPSAADLLLKQLKYIMRVCDPIVHCNYVVLQRASPCS